MTAAFDPFRASPVRRGEEEDHFRQVKDFAHRRWRASRRTNWFLSGLLVASMASNLALSSGVRTLFPLVRTNQTFVGFREDGTVDTMINVQDLTDTERESAEKSAAWTYVKACEGYNYANAQYNYDACKGMSDDPIRQAFEARWFLPNGKHAPESPQKVFGQKGQIDLAKLGEPFFVRDHVIQVRFKRTTRRDDEPPPSPWVCKAPSCTTWAATIEFTLLDQAPTGKQDNNPLKFWVVRYQLSEGAS
jgi:type IV secretory pathway component VirB8